MLHMLARLTDFVNVRMGLASQFEAYVDRVPRTSYDIEHILPDDYETYKALFNDEEDFRNYRKKFGDLILLTSDRNRSYQDMPYKEKVERYLGDNILARSLNAKAYQNAPRFLALCGEYGFKPYAQFDKTAIRERLQLYTALAKSIWDPAIIRELAAAGKRKRSLPSPAATRGASRSNTVPAAAGKTRENTALYPRMAIRNLAGQHQHRRHCPSVTLRGRALSAWASAHPRKRPRLPLPLMMAAQRSAYSTAFGSTRRQRRP